MTIKIDTISETNWNKFFFKAEYSNITQDWSFGEFKTKSASPLKVDRMSVKIDNEIICVFQILSKKILFIPLLKFCYINRGPVFVKKIDILTKRRIFSAISKKYSFFNCKILFINPFIFNDIKHRKILKFSGFVQFKNKIYTTIFIHFKDELEQLRLNLKPKWRNQLVQAEKKQVKIILDIDLKYKSLIIEKNNSMMKIKNYKGLSSDDLNQLFNEFGKNKKIFNFIALSPENNEPIAYTSFLSFSNKAVYLLGWVDLNGRKFNPSNLLLWTAISNFKNLNYKLLDLGGIDEKNLPGVTKFKRGLNGEELTFSEGWINFRLL